MTEPDKDWLEERAAIIQDGEKVNHHEALRLAHICWHDTYGDGRQLNLLG